MNRNIMIVLIGGCMIALVVALIVQAGLKKNEPQPAVSNESVPVVEVLVAAKDLRIGQSLDAADMRWQEWPESSVFSGAVVREADEAPGDVLSGRLRRDIAEGEPILRSALFQAARGNVLAGQLMPGMRAIAVEVDAASMVAGFLAPGDMVDVILAYRIRLKGEQSKMLAGVVAQRAAEIVIENVQVLAVDQQSKKEDDKARVGRTITLQVTPREAEILALADAMGDLSLALRPIGDNTLRYPKGKEPAWPADGTFLSDKQLRDMFDGLVTDVMATGVLSAAGSVKKKDGNDVPIMRIYSGDAVRNMTVRQ